MKRKGFTLIELMVVMSIIAILVAILYTTFAMARGSQGMQHDYAQQQWTQWLNNNYSPVGYRVVASECVSRDTDGNGYVSCTATLTNDKGDIKRENMECSAWSSNEGCRQSKSSFSNGY